MKIKSEDIIATIVIIGAFILIFYKRDGIVASTLAMIVGYYFGKRTSHIPDHGESGHIQ